MLIAILGLAVLIILAIVIYFWKKNQNENAMRAEMEIF